MITADVFGGVLGIRNWRMMQEMLRNVDILRDKYAVNISAVLVQLRAKYGLAVTLAEI